METAVQGDDLNWLLGLGVPVEMLAQRTARTPTAIQAELKARDEETTTIHEWTPEP